MYTSLYTLVLLPGLASFPENDDVVLKYLARNTGVEDLMKHCLHRLVLTALWAAGLLSIARAQGPAGIAFEFDSTASHRLQVLDLMGKEVAVLHDGFLEAGPHHFRFDARSLPSGVYSYRVIMDGATLTRTMVLMR